MNIKLPFIRLTWTPLQAIHFAARGGLAIGSTGTFPGGPVTNGPMDGCFFISFLFIYSFDFFLPCLALVTIVTLPARGERHASSRPTVLICRHSREVTIGPVACPSKEYLAQWPYERLQRSRSPTHACSRPPLVQSPLMMRSRWWERERDKKKKINNTPAHE